MGDIDDDLYAGDPTDCLFIARDRLQRERQRNESLAAINRDVETQNDKLTALVVELYNATGHALAHRERFEAQMRDAGIELEETP